MFLLALYNFLSQLKSISSLNTSFFLSSLNMALIPLLITNTYAGSDFNCLSSTFVLIPSNNKFKLCKTHLHPFFSKIFLTFFKSS